MCTVSLAWRTGSLLRKDVEGSGVRGMLPVAFRNGDGTEGVLRVELWCVGRCKGSLECGGCLWGWIGCKSDGAFWWVLLVWIFGEEGIERWMSVSFDAIFEGGWLGGCLMGFDGIDIILCKFCNLF